MASKAMLISGAERSAALDEVTNLGAQASRNTTTPISGGADWKLAFPSGSTTWNTTVQFPSVTNVDASLGTIRKVSQFFRLKFSAIPAVTCNIMNIPFVSSKSLNIDTSGHLVIDTTASTFVMSVNTVYQIEMISDVDWRSSGLGSNILKIYDNSHVLQDTVQRDSGIVAGGVALTLGESIAKAATGPNTNVQIDDIIFLVWDSTTKKAPWLGQQTIQTLKTPTANGNYNDFTGVGSTTNKYANENENPSDGDTTFNSGGAFGVVKRNTTTTWGLAAGTYTGWCIYQLWKNSAGQTLPGDEKNLFRDNSVDYTKTNTPSTSAYLVNATGSDTLPDLTALAGNTSRISALESGIYTNLTFTTYNTGYTAGEVAPTSDGGTYGSVWATTGANRFSVVADASDATYISSGTLNQIQGLGYTWTISPLTAIGDVVFRLQLHCRGRWDVTNVGGSGGLVTPGVRIGGVDYLCDAGSAFLLDPDLTTFSEDNASMTWNTGSNNNPATLARWTKSDIEGAEWFIKLTTLGSGTGGTNTGIISKLWVNVYTASTPMLSTQFMYSIQGDAQTDNGNVAGLGGATVFLNPNSFMGPL